MAKTKKKEEIKEPTLQPNSTDEAKQIKEELTNLKNQAGWKRFIAFLDGKIKFYETQILDNKVDKLYDLDLYKAKRNIAIQLRNFPDLIIEKIDVEMSVPDLDPFETADEQRVDPQQ